MTIDQDPRDETIYRLSESNMELSLMMLGDRKDTREARSYQVSYLFGKPLNEIYDILIEHERRTVEKKNIDIGDRLYRAKKTNNWAKSQKKKMVDSNGDEWYRYDPPIWDFFIEEWEVVGAVETRLFGDTFSYDADENDVYILRSDGKSTDVDLRDINTYRNTEVDTGFDYWFTTREDAEKCYNDMREYHAS